MARGYEGFTHAWTAAVLKQRLKEGEGILRDIPYQEYVLVMGIYQMVFKSEITALMEWGWENLIVEAQHKAIQYSIKVLHTSQYLSF